MFAPVSPLRLDIDPLTDAMIDAFDMGALKTHCAVDESDFDAVLSTYLRSAIDWAEEFTHRAIVSRQHRWLLKCFPVGSRTRIRLPRGRVTSVDSIEYMKDGEVVELFGPSANSPPGNDYREDIDGDDAGFIMPLRGAAWPLADEDAVAPVKIWFTAGWRPDEMPGNILHALYFAVADAIELRTVADMSSAILGLNGANLEVREAMLARFRIYRW